VRSDEARAIVAQLRAITPRVVPSADIGFRRDCALYLGIEVDDAPSILEQVEIRENISVWIASRDEAVCRR
jgi:hypothetical protein